MVVATGRRPKTVLVKKTAVDQAGSFLKDLPEKPREALSLREAVSGLREQIRAALMKGYSYEDLAKLLSQKGIEISPSTLKNYVPSGRRQAAKDKQPVVKTRGRRARKDETDQSTSAEPESSQVATLPKQKTTTKNSGVEEPANAIAAVKTRKTSSRSAAKSAAVSEKTTTKATASVPEEAAPVRRTRKGSKTATAAKTTPTTSTKAGTDAKPKEAGSRRTSSQSAKESSTSRKGVTSRSVPKPASNGRRRKG